MDWMTLHRLRETELMASTVSAHRRELTAARSPRPERRAAHERAEGAGRLAGRLTAWWRPVREPACVACAA